MGWLAPFMARPAAVIDADVDVGFAGRPVRGSDGRERVSRHPETVQGYTPAGAGSPWRRPARGHLDGSPGCCVRWDDRAGWSGPVALLVDGRARMAPTRSG